MSSRWVIALVVRSSIVAEFAVHAPNRAAARCRLADMESLKEFYSVCTSEIDEVIVRQPNYDEYRLCNREGRIKRA